MEESQDNWIPHLEIEDGTFFNQQNHRLNSSYYDPKEILHHQIPYPSSTLVDEATYTTNFETPLHLQNNPSNINIVDKFYMDDRTCHYNMVDSHEDDEENILSTHILPLINLPLDSTFQSTQVNHNLKPIKKKTRSSSETADHIASERKRRLKLTRNFIALSAIIPGLKKTEKSYILQEAINYVNELQERVRELEIQNEKINIAYSMVNKKLQESTTCETNLVGDRFNDELVLPEVTVKVSENNVLIGIQCEKKQNDIVHKISNLVTNLHLSIISTNIFPFGASSLQITIIAQMKYDYNMTTNDLVRNLRKVLLDSNDVQQ